MSVEIMVSSNNARTRMFYSSSTFTNLMDSNWLSSARRRKKCSRVQKGESYNGYGNLCVCSRCTYALKKKKRCSEKNKIARRQFDRDRTIRAKYFCTKDNWKSSASAQLSSVWLARGEKPSGIKNDSRALVSIRNVFAASIEKSHAAAAHLMMSQSALDLMITWIEWMAIGGGFICGYTRDRATCVWEWKQ